MRRKGLNPFFGIILAIIMIVISIIMTVHDAEYIFTGKTLDLNSIIENGEEIPRDKYVTYACYLSFGNYAETQPYYGFIPLPGESQEYALLTEDYAVISADIKDSAVISEMERLTDYFYSDSEDEPEPVVITGCVTTIGSDLSGYLEEFFDGFDLDGNGIYLTRYEIDTTKTRFSIAAMYLLFAAFGAALGLVSFKKIIRGR